MELDDLIDIYARGMSADDLRDAVAAQGYCSGCGGDGRGGYSSPDAFMVALADRMPGRYAPKIIDQIKAGFGELKQANQLRYRVLIVNHLDRRPRVQKAEELGLTLSQFKTELRMGREYLGIRFINLICHQTECA